MSLKNLSFAIKCCQWCEDIEVFEYEVTDTLDYYRDFDMKWGFSVDIDALGLFW